jgi:ParB/RepB/Spo0J family partition protein
MSTKTKKRSTKASSKPARATPPENDGTTAKAPKQVRIQGVAVMTPDGKKKVGRRGALAYLPIKSIKVQEGFNPRSDMGDLTELEKSVRKSGLLEPLVVRPSGDGKTFFIVAGERRYRVLKSLGQPLTDSVPVNIRPDLEGDDNAALAVALAENSEDGRNNLSTLDLGYACEKLQKKKWTVEAIASYTGLHSKKVRRCLEVVGAGEEIVNKVRDGSLGMMAAIEVKKLPKKERATVLERAGPGTTVEDIRRIRKSIEREERQEAIAKGSDTAKTKAGKPRERKLLVRRSAKELTVQVRLMCHAYVNTDDKERDTDSFYELRGGIAALLWVQGEVDSPIMPSLDVESESDPKAAKKANAAFDTLIKNEAALHKEDDADPDAEKAE